MLLVGLAIMIAAFVGGIAGLMWLATRTGHPRLSALVGAAGAVYFAVTAIDVLRFCGVLPVDLPLGGGGAQACTGDMGELSYAYALLAAPMASFFLVMSTWRTWVINRGGTLG
ncbi:hypothetical protein [Wenxinia marina]|uniref:Uncharacterized protein n=1 Tax=Wenxinia marina DSM 24838 TaxID=1123501 RepID=A0A0D0PYD8_9RHOB|nr:hypothetical protein [Wenxinia marina]KIQ67444.1 hypothetical protein Wenmar_03867 [Wenxinia marina DSM 24838]GGL69482.1 hypothetical protein GCM10011392_24920 [Wenxinia marina]